jgi:hypothetical protein
MTSQWTLDTTETYWDEKYHRHQTINGGKQIRFKGRRQRWPVHEVMKRLERFFPLIPAFFNAEVLGSAAMRYFGMLDIDIPEAALAPIIGGRAPLFANQPAKPARKAVIKDSIVAYVRQNAPLSMNQLAAAIPVFRETFDITKHITEKLVAAGFQPIVLFSGCKGAHILWYDVRLWRKVNPSESYGSAIVAELKRYLVHTIGADATIVDAAIDRGKGICNFATLHMCHWWQTNHDECAKHVPLVGAER